MKLLIAIILTSSISGAAVAQERPDFAGQWILVSASSANAATALTVEFSDSFGGSNAFRLPRYLSASQSTQQREYLSVERRLANHQTFDTVILSASVLSPWGTERTDSFAAFDAQSLVIQRPTRPDLAGQRVFHKEIWSLTPAGLLRISATDRSAAEKPILTDTLYRRTQN
jgi:hypothetical protein